MEKLGYLARFRWHTDVPNFNGYNVFLEWEPMIPAWVVVTHR